MTVRGWALLEFAIEECHTLGLSLVPLALFCAWDRNRFFTEATF